MIKAGIGLAGLAMAAAALALAPMIAQADEVLGSAQFEGSSGHETSGGVTVVSTDNGVIVVLGEDFMFDGAPDPHVAFGTGGRFDPDSELGILASNSGTQTYRVPASLDISGYDEVYIWCVQYSVPLGVATLQ